MSESNDMTKILEEIRDGQKAASDRAQALQWVLIPILAVLIIQTVLSMAT